MHGIPGLLRSSCMPCIPSFLLLLLLLLDRCPVVWTLTRIFYPCFRSDDARFMCNRTFGESPDVILHGQESFTFPYVPSHLHHCLFELIKNSMRAVVELHGKEKTMPPIKIVSWGSSVGTGLDDVPLLHEGCLCAFVRICTQCALTTACTRPISLALLRMGGLVCRNLCSFATQVVSVLAPLGTFCPHVPRADRSVW
jgi:hypothetical protein